MDSNDDVFAVHLSRVVASFAAVSLSTAVVNLVKLQRNYMRVFVAVNIDRGTCHCTDIMFNNITLVAVPLL